MKNSAKLVLILLLIAALVAAIVLFNNTNKNGNNPGASAGAVIINEVMSSNKDSVPDPNGNYYDWVELYNTTGKKLSLSGYGLSDDIAAGAKYVLPAGASIDANGYLVIYCAGSSAKGGYYAPFKLSDTDPLMLSTPDGKVADSLSLKSVESGLSLGRDPDNTSTWLELSPSPGYPNTEEGASQYRSALQEKIGGNVADIDIRINEIMASNATTIADKSGAYHDWIELYNFSDSDIDISGYGISDSLNRPMKYVIPDKTVIKADSFFLIYCSGNSGYKDDELHASFSLRAYGEDVVLSAPGGAIIDSVTYAKLETDVSYARIVDGSGNFELSNTPTPGFSNTAKGYDAFSKTSASASVSGVYVSEIMGYNTSTLKADDGKYYDWIELFNPTKKDVSLKGYALSDNANNPAKWVFPDVTIKSGGYMVVLASGKNVKNTSKKYLETNFLISAEGESIILFAPDGRFLNKLQANKFTADISYGRSDNGELFWYDSPTPGSKNGSGCKGISAVPVFETTPGLYDKAISVTISSPNGEDIFYTTDCSTPTTSSTKYTKPIEVSKNTVIRAVCASKDYFAGYSATGTYLFTTDGVNHALPLLSLVTDNKNLFDPQTGIYCYGEGFDPSADSWPYWQTPANFWSDTECPASFEVFGDNGNEVFAQNIGISISGAFGRGREQKGLAIMARDEYGKSRMEYAFFDNLEYKEYKSLVLRCGAQDQANGKIRDELSSALLNGTDVRFLYQAYKPYVLYLNGRYWGVYFMREKRNRFYIAQHEGLSDATDVTLIKSETRANYGTTEEWTKLMNYVRSHDLSSKENYDYIAKRIDLDSFMDYMICEIYVGNTDYWNIQMYKAGQGKWGFIYYDFCWGWNDYTHPTLELRRAQKQPFSDMFNALLKNASWKDRFCKRFAELMDTVFAPDKVLSKVDELYNIVEPEIKRERSLFNSSSSEYFDYVDPSNYASYDGFKNHIEKIRKFASNRPEQIKSQLKSQLGLSESYMKELFG